MDKQQSDKRSKDISEVLKSIDEWLERTDKNLKNNQRSDESSEEISMVMKRTYKWLEETDKSLEDNLKLDESFKGESLKKILEEEIKKTKIKFPIIQLGDILDGMIENVKEMYNLPTIESYRAVIGFVYSIRGSDCMKRKQPIDDYTIIDMYGIDRRFRCKSDGSSSPDKIICTDYRGTSFELFDVSPSLLSVRVSTLSVYNVIYHILEPRLRTPIDKKCLSMTLDNFTYLNKPPEENPEISIDEIHMYSGKLRFNNNRSNITITWSLYDS